MIFFSNLNANIEKAFEIPFRMNLFLFFIWIGLVSSIEKKKDKSNENSHNSEWCTGPNTKISDDGACECVSKDYYGNPLSPEGCLRCKKRCHANAYCTKKGKCKCKRYFFGDGVHNCSIITPEILLTSKRKCSVDNGEIYYLVKQHSSGFEPKEIFCKFGSYYFQGELVNKTWFKCPCPLIRESTVLSGISFDNENWSPLIEIDFRQQNFTIFTTFPFIVFFILMACFVSTLMWYRKRVLDNRNGVEIMPLNKWHLHQIQQEVGDESRVIDFIAHIATH